MLALEPFYTTPATLTKDNWQAKAAEKRACRDALIPAEWRLPAVALDNEQMTDVTGVPATCGLLNKRELEITELDDVDELAGRIAKCVYSAEEVAVAFCKRAAIAHQLTNCLTEIYFAKAIARAKELDAAFEATGQLSGPLHGVPISLKDQFDIKDTELTMGYAAYLGRISKRDCALVSMLISAGAVLHCRTNVPQTMMISDTLNHVFGRTRNPLNGSLTPGGSSGGEGALIRMKGSILGVGTDIGGSIRIPSSFCGFCGLRPTTRRVPYGFATNSMLGQEAVPSVAGPLARSFRSCTYFLKSILDADASKYDANALPFAFNTAAYDSARSREKLVFGLMPHDHNVQPVAPVKRALRETVAKLQAEGHEVVEFDGSAYKDARALLDAFFRADGGEDIRRVRQAIGEPLLPLLTFDNPKTVKTTYEVWQMQRHKEQLQQAFLAQWLSTASVTSTGRPIDALLCPVSCTPAYVPGTVFWAGYTGMFNLLDLPASAVPVTLVDPNIDRPDPAFKPLTAKDAEVHETYSAEITAGMPVAVQLIGRRWQEEELLAIAERLAGKLADGAVTATEVTIAYCKRAAIAHQLTNCLTEIYFSTAIARAKELDAALEATGLPAGPLHGVPISLKDQFDIEGTELTMGYASYLGRISKRDSSLVKMLRDAGAILHCRTNVPQTLLDGDTSNHVFGRTLNPLKPELSPGGSSGGEGALVALRGAILGVGTDIGGSIRIPASFCGLYGLRPTSNRIPYGFATNSLLGQKSVLSVAGPLAHSTSSCTYFLRAILDANPSSYDATALPFPYDTVGPARVEALPTLVIGVMREDAHVRPHPPVQRAVEEAVEKLREQGHEVVEFDLTDFKGVPPLLSAILTSDGAEDIFRTLSAIDEPLLPHLGFSSSTARTTYETWQLNRTKEHYQQLFLERWLATSALSAAGRPIDALLLPTTAMTACRPGEMRWGGYGAIASLLDLPAIAVPFGSVEPEKDRVRGEEYEALSENDAEIQSFYDPQATAGMPTSLQLIGRRWKDEELLAVSKRVVAALAAPASAAA
ncbi:uncharacterized protein JCM10292_006399 [Rhodotorula paludigena]|uniref:uncharacterized protein n=1 Tax=Rhodotorula paludigena TaxID=86838 RepID=UPI003173D80D